ncbi:hypothetical protein MMC28_004121, partial [Mycoblastus sanguinarius]|nr:hypothetical protein [Mycoblastus sanguinarius]
MESTGFSPSFENTMDALSRTHPHAYAYYQRLRARLGHPLHPDNQRRPLEKPPTRLRFLFAASQEQKAQYQRNDDAEAQRYIRMHEGMVQEHQKIGTTVGHEGQVYSQDDYQRWSTAAKQGEREFRLARTKYTNKNLDPGEQRRAERFHLRQFEIQSEWDEQFCAQREYEDRIRRFADPVKNAARACSPTAATEHGLLTPKSSPILAPKRSPEQIRVEFASAVRER